MRLRETEVNGTSEDPNTPSGAHTLRRIPRTNLFILKHKTDHLKSLMRTLMYCSILLRKGQTFSIAGISLK